MFNNNKVIFKGKGSGLVILTDESAEFEDIKSELLNKINNSKKFFIGAKEEIRFEGKALTYAQEKEIIDIINKNSGMEVEFAVIEEGADNPPKKKAVKDKQEPELINKQKDKLPNQLGEDTAASENKSTIPEKAVKNYDEYVKELFEPEDKLVIYNGFLRSGQLIESDGNVLVMGGVNPGGEVYAGKNVIVFGPLKGKAVAGRGGDKDSFIAAILMEPELLGIGGYVTRFPASKKNKLLKTPSIARLVEEKINIAPTFVQKI